MRKSMIVMSAVAAMSLSSAFAEGVGSRGGGGAWVCRNSDHSIRSVETYDRYEGRSRYALKMPEWDKTSSKEALLDLGMSSLPISYRHLVSPLNRILTRLNALGFTENSKGKKIWGFEDIPGSNGDENCEFKQVYFWIDGDLITQNHLDHETVYRNDEIYNLMSPLDQAALDLHEAVYKLQRTYLMNSKLIGSSELRPLVASLFSSDPDRSLEVNKHLAYLDLFEALRKGFRLHPAANINFAGFGPKTDFEYIQSWTKYRVGFFEVASEDIHCDPSTIKMTISNANQEIGPDGKRVATSSLLLSTRKIPKAKLTKRGNFVSESFIDGTFQGSLTSKGFWGEVEDSVKLTFSGCDLDGVTGYASLREMYPNQYAGVNLLMILVRRPAL